MIKNFIPCFFLIVATTAFAQPDGWVQKKSLYNLVAGRSLAVGFSINGKGYIGTGFSFGFGDDGGWNKDLWQYDTLTNTWTQMASMPAEGRQSAGCFVINNKAYICCGINGVGTALNDLWEYDPSSNSWVQKKDIPNDGLTGPLSFSLNNKGYVGFGTSAQGYYQRGIWAYDPVTNSWIRKKDFPATTVWESFALSDSVNAYTGLGYDATTFRYVSDIWQYNDATDTWVQKNNFNGGTRFNETGFTVDGRLYIIGGENGKTYEFINDAWVYDKEKDKWFSLGKFPGPPRGGAAAFSIGNKGYIGTGFDAESSGRELEDFWELNTKNMSWRQRANFGGGPRDMAVSFAAGDNCILATGEDGTRFKKDVWLYKPNEDAWIQAPDLTYGKRNATGFSIGTKMYIGLGLVDTSHSIINPTSRSKDFWMMDTATKQWTQIADFAGGNRLAATSFVINGKAYVGTGFDDKANATNDLWQYSPATNTWLRKSNVPGYKRAYAISFAINGKGYIGMGQGNVSNFKDIYEYSPATDTWVKKADFPGIFRSYNVAFAMGNKGFAGLGIDNKNHFLTDWWQFEPAKNSWVQKTNFPSNGRWGASAVSTGKRAFVGMGVIDTLYATNDWWEYKPFVNVRTAEETYHDVLKLNASADNDFNWATDDKDDLVFGIQTNGGHLNNISWKISNASSADYHEHNGWFGANEKQEGICLNRVLNILYPHQLLSPAVLRIYLTQKELADFLDYYNTHHNTSYTMDDVNVLRYDGPSGNDDYSFSNNREQYQIIKPSTGVYGLNDEYLYFEFTTDKLSRFSLVLTGKTVDENIASDKKQNAEVVISSNPFAEKFQLRIKTDNDKLFTVRIENADGKILEEKTVRTNTSVYMGSILPHGIFFLHVMNESIQLPVKTIIKE